MHLHRHRGPGPDGRLEGTGRHCHSRHRRGPLRAGGFGPHLRPPRPAVVHGDGREPPRRDRDPGGHPPDQGRASRGVHHRGPVQRVVRSQPGGAPRPEFDVPPRAGRRRAGRGDRARGPDHPVVQDRRARPPGVPGPHLRPTPRGIRPAAGAPGDLRRRGRHGGGRRGPHRVDGRAPPRATDHRRRPQRPGRRPRRGARERARSPHHRQRLPVGRDEDRRRPVRLGRDATALRSPVGGDHEGGGVLSRAPHGEGRPGRQGDRGARHRQG